MCFCFFFFKQKTAYEMRISDWSSDVCSSDLLEAEGYGVIATASGEEALQRLDNVRPQMVLADLRMPDLDGIELLVRIQGRHPSLPVAILSAHGDRKSVV